jgi:hypothetical protein
MSETQRDGETLSRAERAAKPASERQLIMKNLFVGHDRFETATAAVARFHMPVKDGLPDTGSLFVLAGDPRTGKSFALKRYARGFPADLTGTEGIVRPVAYVDLPVGCNKAGFVTAVAGVLNAGDVTRMKVDALFGNVLNALVRQKVQLLILDEVQEAFTTARPGALKDCQGLVRKILNLGTLNVAAAGLVETYRIMAADRQLKGRGGLPHHIMLPYSWESEEERGLFRLLCAEIDSRLPFATKSALGSKWYAARLYWVSDGIIGQLKDFVFMAGCRALNDGAERVEVGHFADAWDEIRPVGMTFNPFRDDIDQAPARVAQPKPTLQPKDPAQGAFVK